MCRCGAQNDAANINCSFGVIPLSRDPRTVIPFNPQAKRRKVAPKWVAAIWICIAAGLDGIAVHTGLSENNNCVALTGLRVGELLALIWQNINFEDRTIKIQSSLWNGLIVPEDRGQYPGVACRTGFDEVTVPAPGALCTQRAS